MFTILNLLVSSIRHDHLKPQIVRYHSAWNSRLNGSKGKKKWWMKGKSRGKQCLSINLEYYKPSFYLMFEASILQSLNLIYA